MSYRLKEVRSHLGLTQEELGNKLGFKWYKIKDLESGKLNMTPEIAIEIEKLFSISGWWLLTGKGEMFLEKKDDVCADIENHIGDKEIDLLKSFRKLDEKKQEMYLFRIKADALEEEIKNDANHTQGDAKYA